MQQDQFFLIVTFPFLVTSFALVSCLKTAWKFKGSADPSEAYTKTLPVAVKPKKDEKKIKPGKTVKKVDGKDKKAKKLSKFFVFNHGKDEDLKTAVGSEPTLDSTQESITEDDGKCAPLRTIPRNSNFPEHESPLSDNYKFSDDEKLDGLQILPSPPPKYVEKLRSRVRQTRRGKKSPQDYYCTDEEDSLFDVPSLKIDPATLKSSRSSIPLNIQDSRLLRLNQDRLAFKKSHTVYPHSAISPDSNRMHRSESRSSRESEPTTISQRS